MNLKTPLVVTLLGLLTVFSLTSCGKGGFKLVQDVAVTSHAADDGKYVNLTAVLDTGGLEFGTTLPLIDPQRPNEKYGTVSLNPSLQGPYSDLVLSVNVTKVASGTSLDASTLPNGSPIPVGGLGATPVFGLQAGSRSRVYVALPQGSAVLGAAMVISEFDSIAGTLPGLNVFPGFRINDKIDGVAGIFTGSLPQQSGIALFAQAEGVTGSPPGDEIPVPTSLRSLAGSGVPTSAPVVFKSNEPSVRQEYTIYRKVSRMAGRGKKLKVK